MFVYQRGCPKLSTGGFPHCPGENPHFAVGGRGAETPGILSLGYAGGGPHLCMLSNHGVGVARACSFCCEKYSSYEEKEERGSVASSFNLGIPRASLRLFERNPGLNALLH